MPAQTAQRRPPIAQIAHFGAPTGGWNSIDNITGMAPEDAVRLDNLFPETTYVRLRRGSTSHSQLGGTDPVRSLMTYSSATIEKLLAARGGFINDVSASGPGGGPLVASGFTSDLWQYVNFSTPGGQFLVAVNGTNKQWTYNGTTWAAATNTLGTGVPDNNKFAMIAAHQQRLFFAAPDSLYLYYLPVNVLQGQLHAMDLGSFLPLGGAIADIGSWTRDNGVGGMDDLLVIITTHGEVLMYQGIDPDDPTPTGWSMIGRFVIGRPVGGHRAMTRFGPDMMVICEDGFQPLAKYLALGQSQALATSISRKIGNAVSQSVKANKDGFGWEAILYPTNNVLIMNVPVAGGGFQQYAVNTITGAWCRFTGLNAWCWALFQGNIYFGAANGAVIQADTGATDQGQPIAYDIVTSFQVLGNAPQQKRATMCRPYLIANGQCNPVMDVNVDYNIAPVTSPLMTITSQAEWDQFNWDQANWSSQDFVQNNFYSVDGIGTAFAVHMSGQAQSLTLKVLAFDLTFEVGMGFI